MIGRSLSSRGAMAFVGGVAAAALMSRLLPPLAAQATGAVGGMMGGDPFRVLVRDHQIMLSLLERMTRDDSAAGARKARFLMLKRRLAAHALAEEDAIYPLLHDAQERREHARRLYAEHAEIKVLMHGLEHTRADDPAWQVKAAALKDLIGSHARDEEENVFPVMRSRLDDSERGRLGGEIRREKALVL